MKKSITIIWQIFLLIILLSFTLISIWYVYYLDKNSLLKVFVFFSACLYFFYKVKLNPDTKKFSKYILYPAWAIFLASFGTYTYLKNYGKPSYHTVSYFVNHYESDKTQDIKIENINEDKTMSDRYIIFASYKTNEQESRKYIEIPVTRNKGVDNWYAEGATWK